MADVIGLGERPVLVAGGGSGIGRATAWLLSTRADLDARAMATNVPLGRFG